MEQATGRRDERGFTLLELLIAMTILAFGLLGIAYVQGTTIKRNVSAMRNTEATALIEDKIEEYRNTPYASISAGTAEETSLGSAGIFTRTSIVENDTPLVNTKKITVRVAWSDPGSHVFSFQTIVSND